MENKEPASSVLIVDDDKSTIEVLRILLQNKGFNVGVASTGKEALAYMKEKKFDIIITDLKMPEIDGYQLLNIIKTTQREQKVMIMSTDMNDRSWFLRRGAVEAFEKPFDLGMFIEELSRLIKERRKAKRFYSDKEVVCIIRDRKDRQKELQGVLINISIDGALVKVEQAVTGLEKAYLEFSLSPQVRVVCRVSAEVVRIIRIDDNSCQIAFYFDDDRDLALLEHFVPYLKLLLEGATQ
jgi:CheY-like chemotaxis protein